MIIQVSLFEQRGGGGGGGGQAFVQHLNTSFLPSIEILTMNYFAPAVVFYLQKGYFTKFELFSSPEGWEFDREIAKNSNAPPRTLKMKVS